MALGRGSQVCAVTLQVIPPTMGGGRNIVTGILSLVLAARIWHLMPIPASVLRRASPCIM